MTAIELLNEGKAALSEVTDEYELDAWYLFEHATGIARHEYLMDSQITVPNEKCNIFREYISKRSKHIPLQHIVGTQWFMGLEFEVNKHVLIPRQDTEALVEEALKFIQDGDCVLDMCTGSGCILLSLLHYSNHCSGIGVDISKEALKVATENAAAIAGISRPNPWSEDTVRFICSDLFTEVPKEKFDIIVSNPPYIASAVIPTLMEEVREHEPMTALDGMEDGLFFYRKIVAESGHYLAKEGMLFFEIGHDQGQAVSDMMREAGFKDVTVVKDFAGLDRVVYGSC